MDALERWPNTSHGKPLFSLYTSMSREWLKVGNMFSNFVLWEYRLNYIQMLPRLKKQLKYADQRGFTYVAMLGDDELSSNTIMVKSLDQGSQHSMSIDELITALNTES